MKMTAFVLFLTLAACGCESTPGVEQTKNVVPASKFAVGDLIVVTSVDGSITQDAKIAEIEGNGFYAVTYVIRKQNEDGSTVIFTILLSEVPEFALKAR